MVYRHTGVGSRVCRAQDLGPQVQTEGRICRKCDAFRHVP